MVNLDGVSYVEEQQTIIAKIDSQYVVLSVNSDFWIL